ncbi:hypothetical protein D0T08_27210 [Emticicia sp. C21]|nr:hypothetical protein D0T08_27210 [Emticicia sp. C21]
MLYQSGHYPGALYMKHWMDNHYIILIGDRIARTRYFCEKPIGYKELATLFNQWQIPTTNDYERDRWTDQSIQEVFYKYLGLLEITEEDIMSVYPNLYKLGIP